MIAASAPGMVAVGFVSLAEVRKFVEGMKLLVEAATAPGARFPFSWINVDPDLAKSDPEAVKAFVEKWLETERKARIFHPPEPGSEAGN